MNGTLRLTAIATLALLAAGSAGVAGAQQAGMSFFVTSTGSGKGADFGGLQGADKHCQALAAAAGAGAKTWHAYLSTQAAGSTPAVNAKDRIGKGPWQNAKGVVIAKDVAELHGTNNLNKQTALTEKGDVVQRTAARAQQARHPDGFAARRHGVSSRRRQDLRQLDEERRGKRDRRPSQPRGTRHEPADAVLEFVARERRLQRRCAEEDRWSGAHLLLRRIIFRRCEKQNAPATRGVFSCGEALVVTISAESNSSRARRRSPRLRGGCGRCRGRADARPRASSAASRRRRRPSRAAPRPSSDRCRTRS